ncbi:retron St85 family RNA-directed DNA polymerase [Brevundimonas diminuta]|uniref:retron St85 family RNA-directed DNA polymerase n=1 Tax=Brevundimonas diminuta TaxID=293 RepID=UPI003F805FED
MSGLLDDIATYMEVGSGDIRKFIFAAPARYKVYTIKKRRGGERVIAQPSATLKLIQKYVVDRQLSAFPIHDAASAYVEGRSIVDNADIHRKSKYILKLDFENFFNSITVRDWRRLIAITPNNGLRASDLVHYDKILFWGDGSFLPKKLSVGAPSSPKLSNMIMYRFDAQLSEIAGRIGVKYTRYADDITISAPTVELCLELERAAYATLKAERYPGLRFKQEKRGLYGPGQRRMVTGLIVTPQMKISLGRERKRHISSLTHHAKLGKLDAPQLMELKGLLGFAKGVEPTFLETLRVKYGAEIVTSVMRFQSDMDSDV